MCGCSVPPLLLLRRRRRIISSSYSIQYCTVLIEEEITKKCIIYEHPCRPLGSPIVLPVVVVLVVFLCSTDIYCFVPCYCICTYSVQLYCTYVLSRLSRLASFLFLLAFLFFYYYRVFWPGCMDLLLSCAHVWWSGFIPNSSIYRSTGIYYWCHAIHTGTWYGTVVVHTYSVTSFDPSQKDGGPCRDWIP